MGVQILLFIIATLAAGLIAALGRCFFWKTFAYGPQIRLIHKHRDRITEQEIDSICREGRYWGYQAAKERLLAKRKRR